MHFLVSLILIFAIKKSFYWWNIDKINRIIKIQFIATCTSRIIVIFFCLILVQWFSWVHVSSTFQLLVEATWAWWFLSCKKINRIIQTVIFLSPSPFIHVFLCLLFHSFNQREWPRVPIYQNEFICSIQITKRSLTIKPIRINRDYRKK